MNKELLIDRLQHDIQTLKEKVDYLQKEMKEVKRKEFEDFIKHEECNKI
jgi:outer membrane murein-binding lipoprotein Lpp|tara:strand:- start:152 stop:298 length:147 start_codon:yes stop_codon:yes gene_type:complete